MIDIYSFFYAKTPELEEGLCTWRFRDTINKFKNDEYYLDYIELIKFCELCPELLNNNSKSISMDKIRNICAEVEPSSKHTIKDIFNIWRNNTNTKEK